MFNKDKFYLKLKREATSNSSNTDQSTFVLKPKIEDKLERLQKIGLINLIKYIRWGTSIVPDGTNVWGFLNIFLEEEQIPCSQN